MPIKTDREYRDVYNSLVPQDDEKRVTGYATVFNVPYKLYGDGSYEIWEKVAPTAFANTDVSDVIMQYNHEGRVFARTKNNTLSLRSDEKGLLIDADLGGTEIGRELYEEIKGGYTDKMSFGFSVRGETWEQEKVNGVEISTRTITDVGKLYDVSAVSIPANDATSISVRSLCDGEIERLKAERQERERVEALEARRKALKERIKNNADD
jgi:HK97 family phage prohead protease